MKSKIFWGVIIVAVLISLSTASASFSVGNLSHKIDKIYGPGNTLRGWVNLSFNDEMLNSVFAISGNSISLEKLLNKNKNFNHTCYPKDCLPDYSASNPETEETFILNKGGSRLIGFVFNDNIISINSIKFKFSSDAGASCESQMKIDFFNNETYVIENEEVSVSVETCLESKNYGCFDVSKDAEEYSLSPTTHCQKINLSNAPGFKIGAWVKETTSGNKDISMAIYDLNGGKKAECKLEKPTTGFGSGVEISCIVDYFVKSQKEHYLCINSSDGTGDYRIKGYTSTEGCAFYGKIPKDEIAAFDIFAEPRKFAAITPQQIDTSTNPSFNKAVEDFINKRYGLDKCSESKKCIVPIKVSSNVDTQTITINELTIKYETNLGQKIKSEFHNLSETPAKLNARFQKFYLDKSFPVPEDYGNVSVKLTLNGDELFSDEISIQKVPVIKSLSPKKTASAYRTEFIITAESPENTLLTKYEWDFGDGKTETTTLNKTVHIYNSTGEYILKIKVTDSKQRLSEKEFEINVTSPEKFISSVIKEMQKKIDNVKGQASNFGPFVEENLNSALNIKEIEDNISGIQKEYASAQTEEDYNRIMKELMNMEIPKFISVNKEANNISFYPDESKINLNVLAEIEGKEYNKSKSSKYIDAIILWNIENIDSKINFKEISAVYESESIKPVINTFELKIKKETRESPYFILKKLENLKVNKNYQEKSGYVYIKLEQLDETIIFLTTENIDFFTLPAFISPEISTFVSKEILPGIEIPKGSIIAIFFFLLALSGIITYIVLQRWYKYRYEKYLFKNINDLYNLITYIENSNKKGLKISEIKDKLKKAGWSSEQIIYAMKKFHGKRTGMFEISLDNIFRRQKAYKIL